MVYKVTELGDIVAFKPNAHIEVLSSLYNAVPTEFQEDFEKVLEAAYLAYKAFVKDEKDNGRRPNAVAIKKEIIQIVIDPFLDRYNLTNYQRSRIKVTKPSNPGIPKEEKVRVERKSPLKEVDVTSEDMGLFNNFDWDAEIPSAPLPSEPACESIDFGELFSDEEFDFESLL